MVTDLHDGSRKVRAWMAVGQRSVWAIQLKRKMLMTLKMALSSGRSTLLGLQSRFGDKTLECLSGLSLKTGTVLPNKRVKRREKGEECEDGGSAISQHAARCTALRLVPGRMLARETVPRRSLVAVPRCFLVNVFHVVYLLFFFGVLSFLFCYLSDNRRATMYLGNFLGTLFSRSILSKMSHAPVGVLHFLSPKVPDQLSSLGEELPISVRMKTVRVYSF